MTTATRAAEIQSPSAKPARKPLTVAKKRQYRAAYLFVLPFFLVFLAMIIVPLGYAGYLSFFKQQLIGGVSFAGFANYSRALTDPVFLSGIVRVALFLVVQVPIMLTLSLFFALALDSGWCASRSSSGWPSMSRTPSPPSWPR